MGIYSQAAEEGVKMAGDFQKSQAQSQSVQPSTAPIPKPIQKPQGYNPIQTFKTNVETAKNTATAGLGKVGDILSRPLYGFGSGLQGAYQGAKETGTLSGWAKGGLTGIKKGLTGENKVTPGQYLTENVLDNKIKNPYAKAGVEFATDIVADPLNALTFGPVRKGISTVLKPVAKGLDIVKESAPVQKAVEFAKKTPALYKPIEMVSPYFRNPEAGKIIEAGKEAIRLRTSQLYRYVDEAGKGLSEAEKIRVGQLLEGGISTGKTDKKLVDIANQFRKLGEEIGAESVKTGLLSPESFKELKGNYMHHMWDVVNNPETAQKFGYAASDLPKIDYSPFKKRTNAEGYVRSFQAPTFKGLGTEIRSNEAANIYKQLGQKFGRSAEPLTTTTDLSKELLNTLLKNKPKIRPGLGEVKPRFATSENIGSELLKTFQEYQPAKGMSKGVVTDLAGGTEKIRKVISPKDSDLFAKTIWGNPEKQKAYAYVMKEMGFTPTESNLKVFLEKVGSLPERKMSQSLLETERAKRLIQDGYKYAPDELTKAKGAGLLKDTALPQEVIDYIQRYQGTAQTELGKIYDAGMNLWKQGKTVWNPAYHVRNVISNQILTDLQTGKGIPATLVDYIDSVRKYSGKGDQKFVKEAQDVGLIKGKYFGEAIQEFLGGAFKKENVWQKIYKNTLGKGSELQSFMEETAKLNVFTEMRKQGKTVEEAMKLAEEAIFSPYRISSMERSTIGKAIPFYSFTRQAAPFLAKKLITHPERFTKYIKGERAIESAAGNPDKSNLPNYMKEMVAIPSKNKLGQQKYFNPQFIYPWGNFLAESNSSTGMKLPFGLSEPPALTEYAAQKTGVDPYYGSKFVNEAMPKEEQKKARLAHLATTLSPALLSALNNKIIPSIRGKADSQGRTRDVKDTLLGELAGLKTYPADEAKNIKSKSTKIYFINKEANTEKNKIRKDQSLTPKQKSEKIRAIEARRRERLLE